AEPREGFLQLAGCPGQARSTRRVLELNVPNGGSVCGIFAAEVQPNVDKLITDKAVRAVFVDRRRALDRDSRQAGLDRHELETLSRRPSVVKLISVAARSNEF